MKRICLFVVIFFVLTGHAATCRDQSPAVLNVRAFRDTPLWVFIEQYAKVGESGRRRVFSQLPDSLINFQEPQGKLTILHWAVINEQYDAAAELLKRGANPNICSDDGTSPFMYACWNMQTSKYAKLLLRFGGNVNSVANVKHVPHGRYRYFDTPLTAAIKSRRLETVVLLCKYRADVNLLGPDSIAPVLNCYSIDILQYLLKNRKLDVSVSTVVGGKRFDVGNCLRLMTYPIGSVEHKLKMKVVGYLKSRGIDYFSRPVPLSVSARFGRDYLERY